MTANQGTGDDTAGWVRSIAAILAAAVGAAALVALAVRADLLTGREPAVNRTSAGCGALPEMAPDVSPVPPDSATTAVNGLLPMLPLPGLPPAVELGYNVYRTPAQYVHYSSPLLGGRLQDAMEATGFRQVPTIGFQAGPTIFGAEAFQLGSPEQAATFERLLLEGACEAGVATDVRPLEGLPGGVTFVYHDSGTPPFRAAFLVGDTVVRLNVCICIDNGGDPYAVLGAWARQVDARMRTLLL